MKEISKRDTLTMDFNSHKVFSRSKTSLINLQMIYRSYSTASNLKSYIISVINVTHVALFDIYMLHVSHSVTNTSSKNIQTYQ